MCIKCIFFGGKNILVRYFSDFLNENPQFSNILYISLTKEKSSKILSEKSSVDYENTEIYVKGKKVKGRFKGKKVKR